MSDVREAILSRLVEVAGKVNGINGAFRNAANLSDTKLPCVVIWDGDEAADDGDPPRQAAAPRRVAMTPEISLAVAAEPELVGTELNKMRARLVSAILSDATLIGLTGISPAGGIRYEGCATELHQGRTMQAVMSLRFSFTYVLRLSAL